MLILDLNGAVQRLNRASVRMLGVPDETTVIGARWPMLLAERDRSIAEIALRAAAAGGSRRFVSSSPGQAQPQRSLEIIASSLPDASGTTEAVLVTLHDVSEFVNARVAAEERELAAIQEVRALQSVAERAYLYRFTIDFRRNVALTEEPKGGGAPGAKREVSLQSIFRTLSPQDQTRVRESFDRARLFGDSFKYDLRYIQENGDVRWARVFGGPFYENGECIGVRGARMDISDEVAAREKIESAQKRLQLAAALSGMVVFELDLERKVLIEEGSLASILGDLKRYEDISPDLISLVDPQDRDQVQRQWLEAQQTGAPFRSEFRIRRSDGKLIWVYGVAELIGQVGGAWRIIGAAMDITVRKDGEMNLLHTLAETRQHEAQQKLLLDELNHRVKNNLTSVQSLAMQTFSGAHDIREGRDLFIKRLLALSATHDLLVKHAWTTASFDELIEVVLKPYGQAYSCDGPDMHLAPNFALSLGMALHELATNAVKYGAWRNGGRVTITVGVSDEEVEITWRESGGPPVSPPPQRGFGLRLLQRGVPTELGGKANLDFAVDGLIYGIQAPISSRLNPLGYGEGPGPLRLKSH